MTKNSILDFIYQAYKDNKMFESILLESNDDQQANELINEVVRMMYCENHSLTADGCEWCLKVKNGNISDYIKIGNGLTAISKNEIADLISKFSSSSIEEGKPKIAVIDSAEDLKVDAANSLLKFLEEPDENTFLFLITKNKDKVLPTIKSRTKLFNLEPVDVQPEENYLVQIIKSKNKDNILLMNNKMKKETREELVQDLEQAQSYFLNVNDMKIYQAIVDLLNDVKFSNSTNFAIQKFVIEVADAVNEN